MRGLRMQHRVRAMPSDGLRDLFVVGGDEAGFNRGLRPGPAFDRPRSTSNRLARLREGDMLWSRLAKFSPMRRAGAGEAKRSAAIAHASLEPAQIVPDVRGHLPRGHQRATCRSSA